MKKLLLVLVMAGFVTASFAQKPTITFSASVNSIANTITVSTSQALPEQVTILFQYQAEGNSYDPNNPWGGGTVWGLMTGYAYCTLPAGSCGTTIYVNIVDGYDSAYFHEASINNLTYDVGLDGYISTALANYIFPNF